MDFEEFNEMAKGYLVRRDLKALELAHTINAKFRKHPILSINEITGEKPGDKAEVKEAEKQKILRDYEKIKAKFGG